MCNWSYAAINICFSCFFLLNVGHDIACWQQVSRPWVKMVQIYNYIVNYSGYKKSLYSNCWFVDFRFCVSWCHVDVDFDVLCWNGSGRSSSLDLSSGTDRHLFALETFWHLLSTSAVLPESLLQIAAWVGFVSTFVCLIEVE